MSLIIPMRRSLTLLALFAFLLPSAQADPGPAPVEDIKVVVQRKGGEVFVDVELPVPATAQEAWAVMTDYEHMAEFISNLQVSDVVSRNGDTVQVSQKGKAQYGPLSFAFDTIREIHLTPYEKIDSRLISGSMKKMEGKTEIIPDGAGIRIVYSAVSIPNAWIPPVVGPAFIERETREQFRELRKEILRRKHAAEAK
jgi:carbon monoxide dehydrogenase subunit G